MIDKPMSVVNDLSDSDYVCIWASLRPFWQPIVDDAQQYAKLDYDPRDNEKGKGEKEEEEEDMVHEVAYETAAQRWAKTTFSNPKPRK